MVEVFNSSAVAWCYCIQGDKAEITERRTVSIHEQLMLWTVTDDAFMFIKPDVREQLLAQMQEMAREAWNEERGRADGAGG